MCHTKQNHSALTQLVLDKESSGAVDEMKGALMANGSDKLSTKGIEGSAAVCKSQT